MVVARQIVRDAVRVLSGERARRAPAKASRFREVLRTKRSFEEITKESSFWRDAKTHTRDGCAPQSASIRIVSCTVLSLVL
jgi:hypothetical protein